MKGIAVERSETTGQGEPTEAFSSLIFNFSSSKKASLVRKRSQ